MMRIKEQIFRNLLLYALLLFATGVYAQESCGLEYCVETALKNSLQLKSDNNTLAKYKASVGQVRSELLPRVNAVGTYQYSFDIQTQMIPAEMFGGLSGTYKEARLGVNQNKSGNLQASQTLYNAPLLISLKIAKATVNLECLQIQGTKEDLIYNVSATYYNIQSILKQEQLVENNLRSMNSLVEITDRLYKSGLATATDANRLTVSRDNTSANLRKLRNNKEKMYNLLKILMNIPIDSNIQIKEFQENKSSLVEPFLPVSNPMLKTNYLQVAQGKQIAEMQLKSIKSSYLPSLSFSGSYGYSAFYNNANPMKNLNDKWYKSSYIGVQLNIPVFDGFSKKYQIHQKKAEIKNYEIQGEQTLQQNSKEMADAYADLKSNYTSLDIQKRSLELAQKVSDDINNQYKSGLVKMSEVINSQIELVTAQNNYVDALISIKQAELNLSKAAGTLMK